MMRMSKDEMRRLDRVAAHYGISRTDVVRMLIKAELDRLSSKPSE